MDGLIRAVEAPQEHGFSAERLERLTTAFEHDVAAEAIPGAVVLVARGEHIVYLRAFGYRDRASGALMRTDTLFRAASMTKPVTVAAAMMLVEEGKLQLFAPVSKYVPAFEGLRVGVERGNDSGSRTLALEPVLRPPTVQDLMRHTAGFTYGQFGDTLVQRAYREAGVMVPGQTNAELLAKLARLPLAHQPGTTFEYGMSTDVLGAVVEIAAGTDLRSFVRERIGEPLGWTDTDFVLNPGDEARLAEPHLDPSTGANPLTAVYDTSGRPAWFSGGGGLIVTATEYLRFAQALLNGGESGGARLLARKTVELMTSNHLPPNVRYGPFTPFLGITAPLPELGQGFGLGVVVRLEAGRNPSPGSVGDFCWPGISGTYWWADPREDLIGMLMLAAPAQRVHYRTLMRDLVYQALL